MEGEVEAQKMDESEDELDKKFLKALFEGRPKGMVDRLGLKNGPELVEKLKSLSRIMAL